MSKRVLNSERDFQAMKQEHASGAAGTAERMVL